MVLISIGPERMNDKVDLHEIRSKEWNVSLVALLTTLLFYPTKCLAEFLPTIRSDFKFHYSCFVVNKISIDWCNRLIPPSPEIAGITLKLETNIKCSYNRSIPSVFVSSKYILGIACATAKINRKLINSGLMSLIATYTCHLVHTRSTNYAAGT